MLAICSAVSSAIARFCLAGMSKPCNSRRVAPSPIPKSTRPLEIRSSVAKASAVRAGWLYFGITWRMPWPSRMRFVREAAAARNTSGADECEYSSRK